MPMRFVSEALHSAIFGGRDRGMNAGWMGTGWRAAKELGSQISPANRDHQRGHADAWFSGFNGKLVATLLGRL